MSSPTFGACWRTSLARFNTDINVVPERNARSLARWIAGPSATGSLNGTPSSITSAPAPIAANTTSLVVCKSGSPQVTYATSPGLCLKVSDIGSRNRQLLPQDADVLVPAAADIDDHHI